MLVSHAPFFCVLRASASASVGIDIVELDGMGWDVG